jgi:riboflavin-specific deaminase-like protein
VICMNLHEQIEHWLVQSKSAVQLVNRPFVTLSYAQSLDGSIALRAGEPLLLSGANALRLTHQLRSIHDGILVGIGTVLSDNPQLTVRHWTGTSPQPIVLDSNLRFPDDARLCERNDKPCWVFTTTGEQPLAIDGLNITALEGDVDGRVCLRRMLAALHERGIRSLMVEGGAHVISAFLKAGLVDAAVITISPRFVGGYKAVTDLSSSENFIPPKITPFFSQRLGDDIILWGNIDKGSMDKGSLANE